MQMVPGMEPHSGQMPSGAPEVYVGHHVPHSMPGGVPGGMMPQGAMMPPGAMMPQNAMMPQHAMMPQGAMMPQVAIMPAGVMPNGGMVGGMPPGAISSHAVGMMGMMPGHQAMAQMGAAPSAQAVPTPVTPSRGLNNLGGDGAQQELRRKRQEEMKRALEEKGSSKCPNVCFVLVEYRIVMVSL